MQWRPSSTTVAPLTSAKNDVPSLRKQGILGAAVNGPVVRSLNMFPTISATSNGWMSSRLRPSNSDFEYPNMAQAAGFA
jgi:hypothetical protein